LHGCFKILMMDCMDVLKCIVGDYANRHWLASTSAKVEGRTERYTRHYESSRRPGL
jgi:hypothetical protein